MAKEKVLKNPIPDDLFNILACPMCKADLNYSKDKKQLVCTDCGQKYPIEEGIPNLMPPKGKKLYK